MIPRSGTITEFLALDLEPLPGEAGERRETGHQCEWAWLLLREAELGGAPAFAFNAARLLNFADLHGFAKQGPMQGAAFDAVAAEGTNAEKAKALALFRHYFARHAAYANQLDEDGRAIWPEDALGRCQYSGNAAAIRQP